MGRAEIQVRTADPATDQPRILSVLQRNLQAAIDADRYRWLYLDNPHGVARVWLAEDAATGEVIGTSAGHPKRASIDGTLVDTLDLSDFAIDKAYRSLGPALKLLRATLEPIRNGTFAFSYDHPSPAMFAIYQRMGGRDVSSRRRWVRLLKVSPKLGARYGKLAGAVGIAGDLGLRVRDTLRVRSATGVELFTGSCGDEFDALDRELRERTRCRVQRSAELLRWRFQRNPTSRHEILCIRQRGGLAGYLVFRNSPAGVLAIVDLLVRDVEAHAAPLLTALAAMGTSEGARRYGRRSCATRPSIVPLPRHEFVDRGGHAGVVVYGPTMSETAQSALQDPAHWWMLEGDEDV